MQVSNNPGLGAYQGVAPLSGTANQFGGQLRGQVNGYVNAMNEYKSGRKPTGDKVAQDVTHGNKYLVPWVESKENIGILCLIDL